MTTLFYISDLSNGLARLDEEESRHLLIVLRKKEGDRLRVTDGKGFFYEAEIAETGKKHAMVRILSQTAVPSGRPARLHLAIAPTKNMDRFEWFLEKATEIGVDTVTPLLCDRSERTVVRIDRLEKILVSAMKQSLRAQLPLLHPLTPFLQVVKNAGEVAKYLAWCADEPLPHLKSVLQSNADTLIAIGPEGDFSKKEVEAALLAGFKGVGLGEARLRTETAGVFAVACYNLFS